MFSYNFQSFFSSLRKLARNDRLAVRYGNVGTADLREMCSRISDPEIESGNDRAAGFRCHLE